MESVDTSALVAGNTSFATRLYANLREQPGNLFLSPFSISTALAMTEAGARGATAEQMRRVLGLQEGEAHAAFGALRAELAARQGPGVTLALANGLWTQRDFPIRPEYRALVATNYGGEAREVDFQADAERERAAINTWVESKTAARIKDLFPRGSITADTRLALASAVYFKGLWDSPFDPKNTQDAPFHAPGREVSCRLMRRTALLRYAEAAEAQIVEIPYKGRAISMVVLLPRAADGLAALERSLGPETIARWVGGLAPTEVALWLPKFTFNAEFDLVESLRALGMTMPFTREADFSAMAAARGLTLTAVVHKAFVEVTEEGTEAAAATGVSVGVTSVPRVVTFRADRPFLFFIRDVATGTVLFLGRVVDPSV